MKRIIVLVVAVLGAACGAVGQAPGGPARRDPSLARLYTFSTLRGAGDAVPNGAGEGAAPLTYQAAPAAGAPPEAVRIVDGRRPGERAVRLDQGFFAAPAPDVPDRAFTAILRFRMHGQGAHRGNDGATNGMLMAVGTGYYDGWRITTEYPGRTVGFEIGRPPGSVGVRAAQPVADGVWHHLAAVWDGRTMRLYMDGMLTAAGEYSGPYTPPAGGALHIGYADSGIGSVVMDVDQAAFYRRALSAAEVLRDAYADAPLSEAQAAQWAEANEAVARGQYVGAEKRLTTLLKGVGRNGDLAAALRLDLGDVLAREGKSVAASEQYARVLQSPAISARLTRQAAERLPALLEQSAGSLLPRRLYDLVLSRRDLEPAERLSVRLSLGHALVAAGNLQAAFTAYVRLAQDPAVPPAWRSLAYLCLGRVEEREKQWAEAASAFRQAAAVPGVPRYRAVEVAEHLAEVARLRVGKPETDPLAGRVRLAPRPAPGRTLWVAPSGRDANQGTKASPFGSLERARDAIRAMRRNGRYPKGGIQVMVRGGMYPLTRTFQLSSQDGGTAAGPIVYRAASGETPVFEAGAKVGGFRPVRDPAVLARLPQEARDRVQETDLRAQGLTDYGIFAPGGYASARGFKTHPLLELFFNGAAMPLAGWPDDGYDRIAAVAPNTQDAFTYAGDRPRRWAEEKDAWLYGYWHFDWADSYEKIASIDPDKKTITLALPVTTYGGGILPGHRFRVVNALSELDHPGEWYLDRDTGRLYFLPPSDPSKAKVQISLLEAPVVEMENVSHVTFQGLTWENGRGDGVIMRGGAGCLLAGCTVRQFGGNGVEIDGGAHHGLLGCDIVMLGRGGTVITGGDRKTLTPGGHFIENCHVHHFSRIDHTYTPAVLLSGVGNRVSHNLFHDGHSSALRIEGNDHLIEYNEVRNVLLESDDQGASDMWANPTYRGNVFRYNFWHDMGNGLGVGQAGIRLDDWISGVEIYGNVFVRCADGGFGAVQINQGTENIIENNVFFDCKAAVSGGAGSEDAWRRALASDQIGGYVTEVNATAPPYSRRYPELLHLGAVRVNSVWRNVVLDCGEFLRDPSRKNLMDNSITGVNPGFADPSRRDFTIRPRSPLWNRLSFQPIPVEAIGLYHDEYRRK